MNNWIGPIVKDVWNVAMNVQHNFWVRFKHNRWLGASESPDNAKALSLCLNDKADVIDIALYKVDWTYKCSYKALIDYQAWTIPIP